jgi:aspartyl-tRNA(Asn)/glutamyl-tRNA(Gln) amidotransferase subunit C
VRHRLLNLNDWMASNSGGRTKRRSHEVQESRRGYIRARRGTGAARRPGFRLNPLRYNPRVPLTREEVEHIAQLAHLSLTRDEVDLYRAQLESILDYAARLRAVDTSEIPPTTSVLGLRSVLREDGRPTTWARENLLRAAPKSERGMFRVPPVFD